MNLKLPSENTIPLKTGSTHVVHSTASLFKNLEESVNVFDPVQNHLLFLRNPSRIFDSSPQLTYKILLAVVIFKQVIT